MKTLIKADLINEKLVYLIDLISSNYLELETFSRNLEEILNNKKGRRKKDLNLIVDVLSVLDLGIFVIDRTLKRLEISKEEEIFLKELKKNKKNIDEFLGIHKKIINELVNLKEKILKEKNYNKSIFRKLLKDIEILKKIYRNLLERTLIIVGFIKNLKIKRVILNNRVLEKLNNTKNNEKEDFYSFIKDVIFEGIFKYKIINDFFIEIKDRNLVIIARKDSLYLKDNLIIEDLLNLNKINDYETYNKYWRSEIIPKEEENEELERFILEEKDHLKNYLIMDSEEFILKYYL